MSRNKLVTAVLLMFLIGIIWWVISGKKQFNLIVPGLQQDRQASTPSPILQAKPKTFQFDSSTDLKQEFEKVDPKVLDSDFE